ncbi:hypothetical protein Scep_017549 [Stephania cephalantha]|uniref:Uncharacterized protein n=1 Tax=Stephania cephalantha TaxID=152367 RepID=A0AAP0NX17_9MAGN
MKFHCFYFLIKFPPMRGIEILGEIEFMIHGLTNLINQAKSGNILPCYFFGGSGLFVSYHIYLVNKLIRKVAIL